MNVLEDCITVAVIPNVLTLMAVIYASVSKDTGEMALLVLVGNTIPPYTICKLSLQLICSLAVFLQT